MFILPTVNICTNCEKRRAQHILGHIERTENLVGVAFLCPECFRSEVNKLLNGPTYVINGKATTEQYFYRMCEAYQRTSVITHFGYKRTYDEKTKRMKEVYSVATL